MIRGTTSGALHNPVMLLVDYAAQAVVRAAEGGWRTDSLECPGLARRVAGSCAQCRFPPAQLLPALAVVLAGRHQGGLSRPREHCRPIRQGGALAQFRDAVAQRGLAQDIRE